MGINKVILVGNVGKDPEVQYINADLPVAKFSLATSESYKDKNGKKVTNTEWHNIVMWRGLAKIAEQYVKKGDQLYIEGKITNRSYEKDGQTRYFTEIVASNMQMLGGGRQSDNNPLVTNQVNNTHSEQAQIPDEEDDLPF